MLTNDPLSRILYIDLSRRKFWVEERRELFEKYIGGIGIGFQLFKEEIPKGASPLGPDNVIIFSTGPLCGHFPLASKTVAVFKSPLNNNLGESHAGGRSSIALRLAGYGAIVIKGSSDKPIYLAIHEDKVFFRDASVLWGMRSSYTVGRVIREREPGAGLRTIIRIGRAGEKLVRYASVVTETYRHFGRMGLGAVMGSKKLKAIVISGKKSLPVKDKREYRKVYDEIFERSVKSPIMKKYHDLGTPANVAPLNLLGAFPSMNLKSGKLSNYEKISGEALAEGYLGRRVACAHCPVACIHLAALREPYIDEPYFYKTTMISYDYELIYALGGMLGVTSPEGLLKLIDIVEVSGLDAISTGVVLAWATEAYERGIISNRETLGLKFRWGDWPVYIKAIKLIVEQPNDFYASLAKGVRYASSRYGGEEFALSFGGIEMPGYHTGPAAYVTYITGARHSHLDSAGYSIDQKMLKEGLKNVEDLGSELANEESWRQILSSLVVCFFARGIYKPNVVSRALKTIGFNFTPEDLINIGREILIEKQTWKLSEVSSLNIKLPKRILETISPHGKINKDYVLSSIKSYFKQLRIELKL